MINSLHAATRDVPDEPPPFLGTWRRVYIAILIYLVLHHLRLLPLHPGLSMRPLDWIVLVTALVSIVAYGLYRSRGSNTVDRYLLAGKTMPWYAMALSIMATQASAITFISTTGQSYVDGMRFVQFYFGLPLAMVILCATVVPVFHHARVYTAYEYLEKRFDAKTRALASLIFLCQRGLSAGLTIYAPALVLSVILGWPERTTTLMMGVTVVTYTVLGGIKAVTWSRRAADGASSSLGLVMALVTVIRAAAPDPSPSATPCSWRARPAASTPSPPTSIGTTASTSGAA